MPPSFYTSHLLLVEFQNANRKSHQAGPYSALVLTEMDHVANRKYYLWMQVGGRFPAAGRCTQLRCKKVVLLKCNP